MPSDSQLPFVISSQVRGALVGGKPLLALESTVITHGLPRPQNLELALELQRAARQQGVVPAVIAVLDGRIHIGLDDEQLARLAGDPAAHKVSWRDFAPLVAAGGSGGTTVAGTMLVAHRTGLRVFATGGIGGVHRTMGMQPSQDVSTDLHALAEIPMLVVCSGTKAILDLPATLERLETAGVPVIGYGTDEFPAFYSRESGLKTSARADTPAEAARIARAHWSLGMRSAVLVTVPPPQEVALPGDRMESSIQRALELAHERGVRGQAVTPFLLEQVSQLTGGDSLRANLGLLRHNAHVGAQIALEFTRQETK
jgi:pseudouridine-5'-phosphate glycosidase